MDEIKKLREATGAGIADCRAALEEAGGDQKRAEEIIRQKGLERAAKKADRETTQGQVFSYVHGGKIGVLVALACETDFVARTDDFQYLGKELCLQVASMNPGNVEELLRQEYIRNPQLTVNELVKGVIGKLGENIRVLEFSRVKI